ncbi:MAG: hypothetical protein JW997_05930 [Actinobacteria bacterium]|nr:hypothetical protein [Actinomycetota bacterium]
MNKDGLILSIDLGTSNVKGAVFDSSGKELAMASIEYFLLSPSESIVENDVDVYWDKVREILKELSLKIGSQIKDVIALVTSSQAETFVPLDRHMKPLRNAIVWIDMRSISEAREIEKHFDVLKLFKRTGYPTVDPSWPATRVLWLKRNEPQVFLKAEKFVLLHDYILYKLSGKITGEATTYNSSYYYDINKFEYIHEMLDFLGIKEDKLPEVVKSGTEVGHITEEVRNITGLDIKTKVIAGAMDQVCGAVGAGNISAGIATETTGSAFAMFINIGRPLMDYNYKLPCALHAVPGEYALMPYSSTGGMVLKWFKDNFCREESETAFKSGRNVFELLDEKAAKISPGSEGLVMLPFLTGAFFPEYDPRAKAVFFGIGINHTKGHFIRSILESLAYMMKNDIEAAKCMGIKIDRIISMGGGASSDLWSQVKADVCNIRIDVASYTETALLGAAIIACVNLGIYSSYKSAVKLIVKIRKSFKPDALNAKCYEDGFRKYKELYKRLKGMF